MALIHCYKQCNITVISLVVISGILKTTRKRGYNMTKYNEKELPTDNELDESLNALGYGLDLSGYGNQ